jgi:hypothetical protein
MSTTELFTSAVSLLSSPRGSRTGQVAAAWRQLKSLISRFAVIVVEIFYSNKKVHARQPFPTILKALPTDLSTKSVDKAIQQPDTARNPTTARHWPGPVIH